MHLGVTLSDPGQGSISKDCVRSHLHATGMQCLERDEGKQRKRKHNRGERGEGRDSVITTPSVGKMLVTRVHAATSFS